MCSTSEWACQRTDVKLDSSRKQTTKRTRRSRPTDLQTCWTRECESASSYRHRLSEHDTHRHHQHLSVKFTYIQSEISYLSPIPTLKLSCYQISATPNAKLCLGKIGIVYQLTTTTTNTISTNFTATTTFNTSTVFVWFLFNCLICFNFNFSRLFQMSDPPKVSQMATSEDYCSRIFLYQTTRQKEVLHKRTADNTISMFKKNS